MGKAKCFDGNASVMETIARRTIAQAARREDREPGIVFDVEKYFFLRGDGDGIYR